VQIAFLLYPGFTMLDAVGPFDVLGSVPGHEPVFVAEKTGPVPNESGHAAIVAELAIGDVREPDVIVVPGGYGTRALLEYEPVLEWLRTAHETTRYTTSVCTGALLLAAAGLLDGAPATTHFLARDALAGLGAKPVPERVVEHGKVITAAGVSSGIDMALRLVQLMYGDELAQAVQLGIEYDPQPPFDTGSPEKAPPGVLAAVTALFEAQEAAAA
jgi:transcriptional regulator GlxA family with amidase domain